jgi:hypothetical protein
MDRTDLRVNSQWDMAFSADAASAASNSPPMPIQNPGSSIAGMLPGQYPMQYTNQQQKMEPVTQPQSIPQQTSGGMPGMPVFVSARDWQHSVASVYDPEGSKRKWGYPSDMGVEHAAKRAR